MTLTELVPALEVCQQLRDKGFPQDTAMVYADNLQYAPDIRATEPPVLMSRENAETIKEMCKRQIELGTESFDIRCAAPTAEEILKELPWTLQPWPPTIESAFLRIVKEPDGFRVAWYTWDNKQGAPCDGKDKHYEKESDAAAQAYLWWKKEVAG